MTLRYLLDTNIVSDARRGDTPTADWLEAQHPYDIGISAITLYELEYGVRLVEQRDRQQGGVLREWLEGAVIPTFDGLVLPVEDAIARAAAGLRVPSPMSDPDAFIAATAIHHNLTLVTRNTADFVGTGVRLLNPWD